MKIKGNISILIGAEGTTIEIEDTNANVRFVNLKMTAIEFQRALSREACVKCEIEVKGLDKIGKKHENQTFRFAIPNELRSSSHSEKLREMAQELIDVKNEGWICDGYFGSQNSFTGYGDNCFANAIIRRYI